MTTDHEPRTSGVLDERVRGDLAQIAGRYPQSRSALLPMLHLLQSVQGYVTPEGIELCAEVLGITTAEVSGVATFYTMYKRRPVGTHHVGVCTNTLCAVMGGDAILKRLEEHLDVGHDETTDDGAITLEHLECNAACDYAPVMMVNWEFFDNQTPDSAVEVVDALREGREVLPTRGARITSWREGERLLAGFPDGRADEGPAAGPASLVGLSIARENDWRAPDSLTDGSADDDAGTDAHQVVTDPSGTPGEQAVKAAEQVGDDDVEAAAVEAEAEEKTGATPAAERDDAQEDDR
ncbi:MAG: NADH-quinone oxidoreductase subunit NuoE [Nocardioidaceae bacterium]|nr:NADH-quinone oxidoreductase subunit NuoE [Nocardioidaceae bacterium]